MDQCQDWVQMINVNISDHEERLQMLESAVNADVLDDDDDHGWAGDSLRQVQQYDIRMAPERQAARLDNHDQRLRAIEHRLLSIEISIRDLVDAIQGASGV